MVLTKWLWPTKTSHTNILLWLERTFCGITQRDNRERQRKKKEKTDFVPASTSLHQPLQGVSSVRYVLLNEHTFSQLVHSGKHHHRVPPGPSTQGPQLLLCCSPLDLSEGLCDGHHQQDGVGSRRAENGTHARPLAVQARRGLRWRVRLGAGIVVVVVSFGLVLRVTGDGPWWRVDHSDPPAEDLCLAHVAVGSLCPRVKDLIPQNGVGGGGLTGPWAPEDQQSALRGVSAPGVPCWKTERLDCRFPTWIGLLVFISLCDLRGNHLYPWLCFNLLLGLIPRVPFRDEETSAFLLLQSITWPLRSPSDMSVLPPQISPSLSEHIATLYLLFHTCPSLPLTPLTACLPFVFLCP